MTTASAARDAIVASKRKAKRLKKLLKKEKRKSVAKKTRERDALTVAAWKQEHRNGTAVDIFGRPLSDHMAERAWQNRAAIGSIKSEQHAYQSILQNSRHEWERQAVLDGRIFDFYCHALGAAIEIDGPVHESAESAKKDKVSDAKFKDKYGILVFRVGKGGLTVKRAIDAAEALVPYGERAADVAERHQTKTSVSTERIKALGEDKKMARVAATALGKVKTKSEAIEEVRKLRQTIRVTEAKIAALCKKYRIQ